jgi:thiol:disulfide interchange protein DsbA
MRFMRLLLAAVTVMAFNTAASAAAPGYTTLATPQRTESGKKVEVIEFFGYFCPHCFRFDPLLAAWVAKQGDNIAFRRVPMLMSGPTDPQAHAYATLESMGVGEALHSKLFKAIHVDRARLMTDDSIKDFVVKNGVDKTKYEQFFSSFAVSTKMKRYGQMMAAYKIDSVPTLVVDGQYVTSPSIAGTPMQAEPDSQAAAIKVLDQLIAKVQKDKGLAPAAAVKK